VGHHHAACNEGEAPLLLLLCHTENNDGYHSEQQQVQRGSVLHHLLCPGFAVLHDWSDHP
jgi:hypothetical protein